MVFLRCVLAFISSKDAMLTTTYVICRGARASITDAGGCTALERAMEMGAITDEELFILLAESE